MTRAGSGRSQPALVPASPWLGGGKPGPPVARLRRQGDTSFLMMRPATGEAAWLWLVRARYGETWKMHIVPGRQTLFTLQTPTASAMPDVVVSVIDRLGNEGPFAVIRDQD